MSEAAVIMIVLVTVGTLCFALPRILRYFVRTCPACKGSMDSTATRCPHCTEYVEPYRKGKTLLLPFLLFPSVVQAQGLVLMDCPDVRFFGPACEEVAPASAVPAPPATPPLAPK